MGEAVKETVVSFWERLNTTHKFKIIWIVIFGIIIALGYCNYNSNIRVQKLQYSIELYKLKDTYQREERKYNWKIEHIEKKGGTATDLDKIQLDVIERRMTLLEKEIEKMQNKYDNTNTVDSMLQLLEFVK